MKKKWTVFSLVILLIQYFSPLVAVAESVTATPNSFSVNALVIGDQDNVDPDHVSITIKGNVEAATAQQQTVTLSGISNITTTAGSVVNSSQTVIGTYQATGQTLQVKINEGVSGAYQLQLNGQLLDKATAQQSLSAGTSQQTISTSISLKAAPIPVEEPKEQPTEPEQTAKEESSSNTKEDATGKKGNTDKTKKDEKPKASKAAAGGTNIDEYLNGKKFFTSMTITDKEGGGFS